MEACIFCRIAAGDLPATKLYEDDRMVAFYDVQPVAPVHVLLIPKKHISSMGEMEETDMHLFGEMCYRLKKIAETVGISENGYRIINNMGEAGGQTVHHIHFHLLGGRNLGWPPG